MALVLITGVYLLRDSVFFVRYIANNICTACSNTNNIIVPLTNLNKCICTDNSEIEVDINNLSENNCVKTLRLSVSWLQHNMLWSLCLCVVYIDVRSPRSFRICWKKGVRLGRQ
jgi:hypothetical protein